MRILLATFCLVLASVHLPALAGDFTDPLFRTGVENSTCPNGVIEDSEQCDDGNGVPGDSCAGNCRLYNCGDGLVDGPFEECDDGNTLGGDGCEGRYCYVETYYGCSGQPSVCVLQTVAEIEPNEDGTPSTGGAQIAGNDFGSANAIANGAFDAAAGTRLIAAALTPAGDEDVFLLTNTTAQPQVALLDTWNGGAGFGLGTACATSIDTGINLRDAGGALVLSNDDRNAAADRCSSLNAILDPGTQRFAHVVEFGDDAVIASYLLQLRFRPLVCGDGITDGTEECDDGNTADFDGCSALCLVDAFDEVEPNESFAQADAAPIQIAGDALIRASINMIGDQDTFRAVIAPARRTLRLENFQLRPNACSATTTLRLYDQAGTQIVADAAGAGIGNCGAIVIDLAPGTYYARTEETGNNTDIPRYFLDADYVDEAGIETEPNDVIAQASANLVGLPSAVVFGDHQVNLDVDVYAITVPPGKGLRAEVIEADRLVETCESNGIDSRLRLQDAAGVQLVADDDDGRGFCSMIDGTSATPRDPGARNGSPVPQTWYLFLDQSTFATGAAGQFSYRLQVTIR
jgi:cysteine-rich repeat protein